MTPPEIVYRVWAIFVPETSRRFDAMASGAYERKARAEARRDSSIARELRLHPKVTPGWRTIYEVREERWVQGVEVILGDDRPELDDADAWTWSEGHSYLGRQPALGQLAGLVILGRKA